MKWIACQIGAREHYAVARALQQRGALAALVTDLWVPPDSLLRRVTKAESLIGRYAAELGDARVFAPNVRMLFFAMKARLGRWSLWQKILAENELFQKEAAKIIFAGALGAERHILFSYSYAARDLFREAKRRGWVTVLGQIDPGPGEQKLVDGLRARYPEWAGDRSAVPPPHYWTEWREECDLADRIVVNSEWSKSLLIEEGIAAGKIEVVPLAYEAAGGRGADVGDQKSEVGGRREDTEGNSVFRKTGSSVKGQRLGKEYPESFTVKRPMRVLFLGQANVRKGIQDLAEAARILGDGPWRFDVVGRYRALPRGLPSTMFFHGQAPRSEAARWYEQADVFILPTHSDGFALTQIEAMAHGLPVLTTPCCGAVVRDGVNGIVFPAGDPQALAGVIRSLVQEPGRLAAMSRSAGETVSKFSIDRVGQGLLDLKPASTQ